jgi:hypothetical protein
MAAENWFGDTMTISVQTNDSSPVTVPVGSAKQVQVILQADHIELGSADTILREAVAKRNFRVPVTITIAAFDDTWAQEWLGGDGSAATSVTDDHTVAQFDITGTITSEDGTTENVTVEDVYVPQLPVMDANEGQWIAHQISGTGKSISLS